MNITEKILIIDFGSQYTQLIARSIREENILSLIHPHSISIEEIKQIAPTGIILSGGPMSVYDQDAPDVDPVVFQLGIPVLGICYGLQLTSKHLGGSVSSAVDREYGRAILHRTKPSSFLHGVPSESVVWMSHGDFVEAAPPGFEVIATSESTPVAAIADDVRKIYGVQFHPEVAHTAEGKTILKNFLFSICSCKGEWTPAAFIEQSIADIRTIASEGNVICALSGGVDSTVAAMLVKRAIGDRLHCIHIDNGLMRKNESVEIVAMMREELGLSITHIDASEIFLTRLAGVEDPEMKRKIIGKTFIDVFEEEAEKISGVQFLVQGTLYPDVIESVSVKGASVTIKSHHNVGGLPEDMQLQLIEPLRELFKDEVRKAGRDLGIPAHFLERHPFPGPGLAVRVLGDITKEKLDILREADDIYIAEIKAAGLYDKIWQAFSVLLPVRTVGVMGDARTYENVLALRAVTSSDGMTADWFHFPHEFLASVSNKISNRVSGINRVVYDISSKPPATIEWE
ncbi:GMP synthase (glutamine-hydrolysing) [Anaerolineae bacterium]|nr:GMP synthase (glutamine-hydrolysing) [Anaerolineae bacterium]